MLRHKMDTKQQGEHIEHKPKKQAKCKKHFIFPRMSKKSKKCLIAASAGEKSQQKQKAKLFLGTTMLIACTKMNPLPPQMLDLMSKTMKKLTKTVFRWPFWSLDTCDKSPLNPGNSKKAIFIATRDTVVLTLFCSVDICTYGSWTGKMMLDGTTEPISCITQHEDYLHHSERSKRQIVPSSCRRI